MFAVALLSAGQGLAAKAKCTTHGKVTRCVDIRRHACFTGDPTVCVRARETCDHPKGGPTTCRYRAVYRRCRGFLGNECRLTHGSCTVVQARRDCFEDTRTLCRFNATTRTCERVTNRCSIRTQGFYLCTWRRRHSDCPRQGGGCTLTIKQCVSHSGQQRARCEATVTKPSGG